MGADDDVLVFGRPVEEVGIEVGGLLPLFDNEIVGPLPGLLFLEERKQWLQKGSGYGSSMVSPWQLDNDSEKVVKDLDIERMRI